MTKSFLFFALVVSSVASIAQAQDRLDAGTVAEASGQDEEAPEQVTPLGECFVECARRMASFESAEEGPQTVAEMSADCRANISACQQLDEVGMRRIGRLCDEVNARRRPESSESGASPARSRGSASCIMPDGERVDRDNCGCPSGTYPLHVSRQRSQDRLRSLGIPRGRSVWVCYNPLAPSGTPGSADRAESSLLSMLTEDHAALTALCAPQESESLRTACARAREEFLSVGSTTGPVDFGPIMSAIAEIAGDMASLRTIVEGNTESIQVLSHRVDVVVECLVRGSGHEVSYTDTTGATQTYPCPDILAAANRRVLDEARVAAAEAGREAGREGAREELARVTQSEVGNAFAMLQIGGPVTFNPYERNGVSYGMMWGFGLQLTIGVSLGDGWNAQGGIGVGYGGPDVQGLTNVQGDWRLGFGATVIPELIIGFGAIGWHRFLPDVFSAESIYGAYLDATIRFLPMESWTPVLTIRLGAGASPRQSPNGWTTEANGLLQVLFGIARF